MAEACDDLLVAQVARWCKRTGVRFTWKHRRAGFVVEAWRGTCVLSTQVHPDLTVAVAASMVAVEQKRLEAACVSN